MTLRSHPPRRHAFTLVELLVVIGVIAVLISILLPALNSARRAANAVKCAAALKDIGRCIQLYTIDNHGWMIPGRAGAAGSNLPTAYNLAEMDEYARQNPTYTGTAWWYMFISKYVSKSKGGVDGSAGSPNDKGFMNSIIWGCPEYRPHKNGQPTPGEFTRVYPGYGLNDWPTYNANNPALNSNANPQLMGRNATSGNIKDPNGNYSNPATGIWFKFVQYTHPAERCMVSESDNWELQAKAAPTAQSTIPNQHAWTFAISTDPNNDIDCYRHGKYPPLVNNAKEYAPNGGKVGYNILYCDGHVALATARDEAYRSLRMRFPG